MAQAPLAIPFQGVVRNANNVLIGNKTISVRFSIHNGFSFGNIIYREWQTTVTNTQGLFVLNVGQGNAEIGQFSSINWSDSTKFMQVEIDTTNSKSVWRDIGTQQMLSVPYALSARKADSASNGVPVGTVIANASNNVPFGWLICNGKAVNRKAYNALFASIGTTYGLADGIDSFNVPDYRGMFLRGMDLGAGNDPDTTSRVAPVNSTSINGGNIGTFQADAFQGHLHDPQPNNILALGNSYGSNGIFRGSHTAINNSISTYTNGGTISIYTDNSNGKPRTASESRPKNVYVNYIIKY